MTVADTIAQVDVSTVSKWEAFFQGTEYMQKVREVEDLYPDVSSISIEFSALNQYDADLAVYLLDHPDLALLAAQQAVHNLMHQDKRKAHIAIRLRSLPRDARATIRELRGATLGRLVSFEALVTRATQVKNDVRIGHFKCARCGAVVKHPMDSQLYSEPFECYKEQEGCGRTAGTTRFKFLPSDSETVDVQKIECQEPLESNKGGTSPAKITVWLSGDLAGSVNAGNRLIVNGIPRMVKGADKPKSSVLDSDIDAVSVEVQGQEFSEMEISDEEKERFEEEAKSPRIYSNLIASIAPSIKGYEMEKAAMLLQQFGGLPKNLDDGTRIRGDIHILLVGEPGVAKSVMLRYMTRLAPRGVFASGKSSTAAGLTVAAVPDAGWGEGRWTLEAGAMVLADGGFLGIDELDKMREEDRSSMHEGMEQQQITKNAAGINATLNTRCSILAAMNPELGRFNPEQTLVEQLNIPDTLISRFDCIFVIQDHVNEERDRDISGHMLRAHLRGGALANKGEEGMDEILEGTESVAPHYAIDFVRKYIAYARRLKPVLRTEAMEVIQKHYVTIRKLGEGDDKAVPITPRQLDGYVRMAEASARMRLSKRVEVEDAKRAIDLVEYYLNLFTTTSDGQRDADMLMTNVPKNKRDKLSGLMKLIKSYGHDDINLPELEEEADAQMGMAPEEVREAVKRMLNEGDLMQPNPTKQIYRAVI